MIIPLQQPDKEIITHNLIYIRRVIFDMTQDQFAEWLGVTRNVVKGYELESNNPTIDILKSLDHYLDIDLNMLFNEPISIDNFTDFLHQSDKTIRYIESLDAAHKPSLN